jgi:mono/diheme cytochrome c family protein
MTHVLMPLCALLAMALPAVAAETDDARKGRELAAEICADCHAIRPADGSSPNADAPGFETIARVPGMSPMSLKVALRTSHREMPNLVLDENQTEQIITYILSLSGARQ